jgi:hypothetical protein
VSDTKKVATREEIEVKAYEIYLTRGGKEGSALDDWLAAEKELSESIRQDLSDPLVKRATAS